MRPLPPGWPSAERDQEEEASYQSEILATLRELVALQRARNAREFLARGESPYRTPNRSETPKIKYGINVHRHTLLTTTAQLVVAPLDLWRVVVFTTEAGAGFAFVGNSPTGLPTTGYRQATNAIARVIVPPGQELWAVAETAAIGFSVIETTIPETLIGVAAVL